MSTYIRLAYTELITYTYIIAHIQELILDLTVNKFEYHICIDVNFNNKMYMYVYVSKTKLKFQQKIDSQQMFFLFLFSFSFNYEQLIICIYFLLQIFAFLFRDFVLIIWLKLNTFKIFVWSSALFNRRFQIMHDTIKLYI